MRTPTLVAAIAFPALALSTASLTLTSRRDDDAARRAEELRRGVESDRRAERIRAEMLQNIDRFDRRVELELRAAGGTLVAGEWAELQNLRDTDGRSPGASHAAAGADTLLPP